MTAPEISVVIPAFRETDHLDALFAALSPVLATLGCACEVIVVDDGSPDETFATIERLTATRPWLRGVRLSRNFGKEAALLAGLREARGRAVVTMDADLQHPADVIPQMVTAWKGGAHIVHAVKRERAAHGRLYSFGANLATRLISRVTHMSLESASDFKLLDREIVDLITTHFPERGRFYRGLTQWLGFNQVEIPFTVARGSRDDRRWTLPALVRLALNALVSFTNVPMQIVTVLGVLTLLMSAVLGADALISYARGETVSGFATIVLTLLIIGSFIMISLGIIGLYIAKIYEEIKARPPYIVQRRVPESPDRR